MKNRPVGVYSEPSDLSFSLPRGHTGGQGHSQLNSIDFCVTTQVLCYFPCTPRATALRQARVSGGNLQNCAPSAACGGAMTEESNVPLVPPVPPLTCTPAASPCEPRSCRRTGKRCRRWTARSADADPSVRPDKCNPSSGSWPPQWSAAAR